MQAIEQRLERVLTAAHISRSTEGWNMFTNEKW